jgi:hypothetical protein
MPTFLDFENDNNALEGKIHKFQTSILEADHPPLADSSNKVATTGWITNLLGGDFMYPQVTQAGNLAINVSEGYIKNPEGESLLIPGTTTPISVVGGTTEYVYIRYSDLRPVVSTILPSPTLGFLLAIVESDNTQILSINQVTPNAVGWPSNDSPFFTGEPQGPTPPAGDCSNALATTEFICEVVQALLNNEMLGNQPQVVDAGGLNVNVTEGDVTKPNGEICSITPLIAPVGVNPNSLEYIYVRYVDCAVVASTTAPGANVGLVLGTAQTDDTNIINIVQMAGTLTGLINSQFAVGFGGNLVPKV